MWLHAGPQGGPQPPASDENLRFHHPQQKTGLWVPKGTVIQQGHPSDAMAWGLLSHGLPARPATLLLWVRSLCTPSYENGKTMAWSLLGEEGTGTAKRPWALRCSPWVPTVMHAHLLGSSVHKQSTNHIFLSLKRGSLSDLLDR